MSIEYGSLTDRTWQGALFVMAALTESMFDKLSKKEMWKVYSEAVASKNDIKEIKSDTTQLLESLGKLEKRVEALEGDLAVTKQCNSVLKKEISRLGRLRLRDNQYGRLENLEISGIPTVDGEESDLEEKVIAVAREAGVTLTPSDISACHRLKNASISIVRFVNRKHADKLWANSSNLKGKDMSAILGADHPKVYINPNLSPELRSMRWKARKFKEAGLVEFYGANRQGVYVQKTKGGEKVPVELDEDLAVFLEEGKTIADIIV